MKNIASRIVHILQYHSSRFFRCSEFGLKRLSYGLLHVSSKFITDASLSLCVTPYKNMEKVAKNIRRFPLSKNRQKILIEFDHRLIDHRILYLTDLTAQ